MDSTNSTATGGPTIPEPDARDRGERLGRRLGAYAALSTARRVLRLTSARELAAVLDQLTGPDDLAMVLRQLEDLADQAAQKTGAMAPVSRGSNQETQGGRS